MRWLFSFTLTLLLSGLSAQPNFQYNYSIFDSCPNPTTYHIASRKITVNDSLTGNFMTRTEFYDRQGKIIRVSDTSYGRQWADGNYISATFFTYDNLGRIISDSTACDSLPWMKSTRCVDKYTYDTIARCITKRMESFGFPITQLSYYNDRNEFTRFYVIDPNGDTSQRTITKGDTTITLNIYLDPNGKPYLHDSTIIIKTSFTWNAYYWHHNRPSQRLIRYYNRNHQLRAEVNYHNDMLLDSTRLMYNRKGRLTRKTFFSFPNAHFLYDTVAQVWQSDYVYNRNGQVIEIRKWEENHPKTIYITRYARNEKSHRIEEKNSVRGADGKETEEKSERWEYTYW